MKKTTLNLLLLLLFTVTMQAQTTYTYSGSGDWSNTANWSPSYPGTYINVGDTVYTNGTVTNNGTLWIWGNIDGSGTVTNNANLYFYGGINQDATLSFTNFGILNLNNNDNNTYYGSFSNSGSLNINSGVFDNDSSLTNTATGTMTINGNTNNASYNFTNDGVLTVYGTFESVYCTNNGTITVNNNGTYKNTSQLFNTGIFNNNGTLTGVNTHHTGNFSNPSILSPGNSPTPGPYVFINDYTHESTATLITELESTSNFDTVLCYGAVTLGGTIDVSLLNGFTPSVGDSFTILTASSISGTFNTVNLPSGHEWNINYTATEVILEVAPTLSSSDFDVTNVALYPNPASNFITIHGMHNEENYKIYNTLGQEVKSGSVTNNAKINIQNLNIGLYFLKFEKGETIKFLKE